VYQYHFSTYFMARWRYSSRHQVLRKRLWRES